MKRWAFGALLAVVALACDEADEPGSPPPATTAQTEADVRALLRLPPHFQLPAIPPENPLTHEKIQLGRRLFYDRQLSANGQQSCADCHHQGRAFAEDRATSVGSTGSLLKRNSQGLANVAYASSLTWASSNLLTLELQLHIPLTNDAPVELGLTDGVRDEVLRRFDETAPYPAMFRAAFPESSSGATLNKVIFALASFCRTIVSGASAYDRFLQGDRAALTEQQKQGFSLFTGERFECFHCHEGTQLTTAYHDARRTERSVTLFNNGLYNVDGEGSYPAHDQGLFDLTLDPAHRGLFRPPSLRNVALTAPYMHDGSITTLRGVVEHYAAGGRVITEGAFAGDGRTSPLKSGLVRGFAATDEEIDAVVAFLEALTDPELPKDPALGPPPAP